MNTAQAQIVHENSAIYDAAVQDRQASHRKQTTAVKPARESVYNRAARLMNRGKLLVITGFVLLLVGGIAYCVAGLSAGAQDAASLTDTPWLILGAQATLAIGTLLWLIGSFLYFLGGLDSDPDGPDLYF
jgi:hypothetical protein